MSNSPLRAFVRATLGGAALAAPLAGMAMYIAWQHNPQGQFHEAGVIHWAWFQLGLLYVGLGAALGALIGAALAYGARKAAG